WVLLLSRRCLVRRWVVWSVDGLGRAGGLRLRGARPLRRLGDGAACGAARTGRAARLGRDGGLRGTPATTAQARGERVRRRLPDGAGQPVEHDRQDDDREPGLEALRD